MASKAYSFIDIAVLDAVRERFARGETLLILDSQLDHILWANGPGARLLGFDNVDDATGSPAELGPVTRRQIAGLGGFPLLEGVRNVAARIGHGGQLTNIAIETIRLAGENFILISQAAVGEGPDSIDLDTLVADGQAAAVLDAQGIAISASREFSRLGLAQATLDELVRDVRNERDRLVKRKIYGASGLYPAAIARLIDNPARHLLLVVAEAEAPKQPAATKIDTAFTEAGDKLAPEEPATKLLPSQQPMSAKADIRPQEQNDIPRDDRTMPPARFIWRTDPEGRFSAVSDEFGEAVGQPAADILGRTFRDVARVFAMDHDHEVADLLERRDTWSGRTLWWPLAGTALHAPVDLAALPVYGRDRTFEGFRGFGVVRRADARPDPEIIGLSLVPGMRIEELAHATPTGAGPLEPDAPVSEPDEADPFRGEVPALQITVPTAQPDDKIVRLDVRRQSGFERNLSSTERQAFREIGERLRREHKIETPVFGKRETIVQEKPDSPVVTPDSGQELDTAAPRAIEGTDHPLGETARPSHRHVTERTSTYRPEIAAAQRDAARIAGTPSRTHPSAEQGLEYDGHPTEDSESSAFPEEEVSEDEMHDLQALEPASDDCEISPDQIEDGAISIEDSDAASEDHNATADGMPEDEAAFDTAVRLMQPDDVGNIFGSGEDKEDIDSPSETKNEVRSESEQHQVLIPADDNTDLSHRAPQRTDTSILDQLPVPVLIHSGEELHYANPEFLRLTGYDSLDELVAAGGLDELFADSYDDLENQRELRIRNRQGESFPAGAVLRTAPWAGRKALMLVIHQTGEAVASHSPAIDDLRQRLDEMRTIINTATDGFILVDKSGAIRSISEPAEALFGFESDDVRGKPLYSLFDLESQGVVKDYLRNLALGGVASVLNDGRELLGREAEGRSVPLFMTMGRLPGEGGFCAVVRDITPWKRAEDELNKARANAEHASAQKSEFLARVSHEIRTPLNAIIGFSELMVDEKFGPISNDRYRDYVRDINRSGNHVLDLVNDLLDLSKIEAGQQEMAYEAVSLNETLAEAVAMMQPQANRERVIIRSSFAPRLPDIIADIRSIRQIALNILSNAVRYTQVGGQVVISTALEGGQIAMRVRDTGIGMTQAELEQAMKPFQQINALKRQRGDGTGLGLPLTKAMVEANRARFAISSTPGEGTLVEIIFPSTRVLAQ